MAKRMLQALLIIIGLIALITGFMGFAGIQDTYYAVTASPNIEGNIILDSNLRYFSGLWVGVGLMLVWIALTVEQQKQALRFAAAMIFLGGIGRVVSMISFGAPPILYVVFTALELAFPLLIFWHNWVLRDTAK